MWPKNEKQRKLIEVAKTIAAQIRTTAPKHDRKGSFPHEHYQFMRNKGYLKALIPLENGGYGHGLTDLVLAQYEIGKGDGSTSVSVGMHHMIIGTEIETRSWPAKLRDSVFEGIVQNGALINSVASEPDLGSPRGGGRPVTKLEPISEGKWLLNGRKTWSTLAPELTYAIVFVAVEDGSGDTARIIVNMETKGISIEETWDSLSMRASGSHDILFDNVVVDEKNFLSRTSGLNHFTDKISGAAWFPLLLSAANLGIAKAAQDYAIHFAKNRKPSGRSTPISQIPHIREQIARMESIMLVARRTLFSCSEDWEYNSEERKDLLPEILVTKVHSIDSAIKITDIAMRVVGAVGLEKNRPLERYFRDVRSGISNPPIEARALEQLASKLLD